MFFITELVLKHDSRMKKIISKFETIKEIENDVEEKEVTPLFEEINYLIDVEAMKCHLLMFSTNSHKYIDGVDFYSIIRLFRELKLGVFQQQQFDNELSEHKRAQSSSITNIFASFGCIRVGIAIRLYFDYDLVFIASEHANESFRDDYIQNISKRLSTTKVYGTHVCVDFVVFSHFFS